MQNNKTIYACVVGQTCGKSVWCRYLMVAYQHSCLTKDFMLKFHSYNDFENNIKRLLLRSESA